MPTPLPLTPVDVSAAWLAEVLVEPVETATVEDVRPGAAAKVRVALGGPGVPPGVVVKAPMGGTRLSPDALSFFALEVEFYREVAPLLDVGLARCLFAEARPEEGQAVVVLEDLTGSRFLTAGDCLDPQELAGVLDVLARLHATTWRHPVLAGRAPYPGPMRPVLEGMLSGRYWSGCLGRPRSASVPAALRAPGALLAAVRDVWRRDAGSSVCVVHGDAHVGNAFQRPDGTWGLLDWQMWGPGHWAHDVAYVVTSALDPAERAGAERSLLRHYLARLRAHGGPALEPDDAWEDYRRHLVHGLFWATNADGMYPEDVNARVVERFSRALVEHGLHGS